MNNVVLLYCKKILSRLAEVLSKQEQTAGGVLSIQSDTESILSSTLIENNSVIKSTQRGLVADVDLGTSGDTYKINLSPINISKCLFIWKYQERLGSIDRSSYTMELKEDCILFTNTSSGSYYVDLIDFDWQIIEFY